MFVRMLVFRVLLLIALVGKSVIGVSGHLTFLWLRDSKDFSKNQTIWVRSKGNLKLGKAGVAKLCVS